MQNVDLFFLLLGAVLVLAMHAGFAFLELGTVRHKNQVNALSKILTDFSISAIAYFFIGYYISYGLHFFHMGTTLSAEHGYNLMRCFFLLTFAAAIPAIISGGIAERAKMRPQAIATLLLVALVYPFFEGIAWNGNFGLQNWLQTHFGAPFHDFAGSVVVHAMGGWIALAAVILLGARHGRYKNDGRVSAHPPSSIPFLALGSWILIVGWFGFNVMSAQRVDAISGLVAINSLMAMVGGTLSANLVGKNDPGFLHNGPLAGLVAICAGSDVVHPFGALLIGLIAGVIFVKLFTYTQNKLKIDDVLGVWPLHGVCGVFGGLAVGIFGQQWLGGLGHVSFPSQLIGSFLAVSIALLGGFIVYGVLKMTMGIRLSQEEEFQGADLSIHKISANSEEGMF
ncbi:MAG TPA: ammonium transporter [Acinetobacter ursingii]|uniref:ammonium transporter n=1 Tax=Acinetobacter ursingii TaxID=108980 RepID=UPI0005C878A5|nr:ammonium transporter [Acinetobacter ursingii]MCH2006040.1 ammonium transporter [Acinetobacter ursingii]MCU4305076.1 ammonium transporter [Acinetobacter ursingii]MCU4371268.1 ammonium transporter [Acinetobacter ursingii]MCU4571535.1 ammonium transporter [Acinetobacter ursingii]MCU4610809.1 ammonium transporter [Acinetobacter ursingii]